MVQVSTGITADEVRSMLKTSLPVGGSGPIGTKTGETGDDRVKSVETVEKEPPKKVFLDVMSSFHHGSSKYQRVPELFKSAYNFTFISPLHSRA